MSANSQLETVQQILGKFDGRKVPADRVIEIQGRLEMLERELSRLEAQSSADVVNWLRSLVVTDDNGCMDAVTASNLKLQMQTTTLPENFVVGEFDDALF